MVALAASGLVFFQTRVSSSQPRERMHHAFSPGPIVCGPQSALSPCMCGQAIVLITSRGSW